MFRQQPMGKYQIKICRTLSCALGGGYELHKHFCEKLPDEEKALELKRIREAAVYAKSLGLKVVAGHGLNYIRRDLR